MKPHRPFFGTSSTNCLVLLVLNLLTLPTAHAFNLQEAWAAAQQHNADFQAAYHQRSATQEQQNQARAAFLPRIQANASYQRQPPSISSTQEMHGWNIQLSQTLFDAGKIAQYRQSKHNSQAAEQRYQAAREDLLIQVAEAYFNLLLSKDTIAAHARAKEAYAQQVKQAQQMFNRGAATALDIHEAKAGYDNALAEEIAAIAQKQIQENQLNNHTGLNSQEIEPIATENLIEHYLPKLQQHSLQQWQNLALTNNYQYQTQIQALKSSEQALKAAQNSRYPTVQAHLGYQNNQYTTAYQNGDYRQRGKGLTASIQLSMPLYTGGELSSKIRQAQAETELAQAQLIASERQIKLAVRQAHTEANAARYQILAQERVFKSSSLKLQSTKTGRQYGIRNSLEVVQARQEVAQAEQKLAQARYRFILAYLRLIKESGLGVEGSL